MTALVGDRIRLTLVMAAVRNGVVAAAVIRTGASVARNVPAARSMVAPRRALPECRGNRQHRKHRQKNQSPFHGVLLRLRPLVLFRFGAPLLAQTRLRGADYVYLHKCSPGAKIVVRCHHDSVVTRQVKTFDKDNVG
jgi:hypothetical protein